MKTWGKAYRESRLGASDFIMSISASVASDAAAKWKGPGGDLTLPRAKRIESLKGGAKGLSDLIAATSKPFIKYAERLVLKTDEKSNRLKRASAIRTASCIEPQIPNELLSPGDKAGIFFQQIAELALLKTSWL